MDYTNQFETDPLYDDIRDRKHAKNDISAEIRRQFEPQVTLGGVQSALDLREYAPYFKDEVFSATSDPDELRARRQSTGEIWGRSLKNMGLYAGTTFLDNVVGSLVGLGNLAIGGEDGKADLNDFVANPLSELMVKLQRKWESPIYRTREEEADVWSGVLPFSEGSSKFWGDIVLKNFGFTLGAVAAGTLTGGALMSGAKGLVGKLAKGVVGKVTKSGKTIQNLEQAVKAVKNGELAASELTGDLLQAYKNLKTANIASQVTGAVVSSAAESRFEAINAMNEFNEKEKEKYEFGWKIQEPLHRQLVEAELAETHPELFAFVGSTEGGYRRVLTPEGQSYLNQKLNEKHQQGLAKIEEAGKGVANTDFGFNMAVLVPSQLIQFGRAFSGGFKTAKKAKGIVGNITEKYSLAPTGKFARGLKATGRGLRNVITEAEEEQLQQFGQTGSESFYSRQLDPLAGNTVDNAINAFHDAAKEAWGSAMGWQQAFVGGITGLAGTPTVGTRKSGRTGVTWAGGLMSDIREGSEERRQAESAVASLNKAINTPEFKRMYVNAIRNTSYEFDKQRALDNDDPFGYKNSDFSQLVSSVIAFKDAGKLDDLVNVFQGMRSASEEEIKQMYPNLANEGSYAVHDLISKRANKLEKAVREIVDLKDAIDNQFEGATETTKNELLHYAATVTDVEQRMKDIERKLSPYMEGESLTTDEGKKAVRKKINETVGPFKEDYLQMLKDYQKLADRRDKFADLYKTFASEKGIKDLQDKQSKEEQKAKDKQTADEAEEKVNTTVTTKDGQDIHITKDDKGQHYQTPVDKDNNPIGESTTITPEEVNATQPVKPKSTAKEEELLLLINKIFTNEPLTKNEESDIKDNLELFNELSNKEYQRRSNPDSTTWSEVQSETEDKKLTRFHVKDQLTGDVLQTGKEKTPGTHGRVMPWDNFKQEFSLNEEDLAKEEPEGNVLPDRVIIHEIQETKADQKKSVLVTVKYKDGKKATKTFKLYPEEDKDDDTGDTNPAPQLSKEDKELKRSINNLFRRLAGRQITNHNKVPRTPGDPYDTIHPSLHQNRYFNFVNFSKVTDFKLRFLLPEDFFGKEGWKTYKGGKDEKFFKDSIVAVVVNKDNQPIDENKNVITLEEASTKGIYSFVPLPNENNADGSTKYHVPKGYSEELAKEKAIAEREKFKISRNQILQHLRDKKIVTTDIRGKSGGMVNYIDNNDSPQSISQINNVTLKVVVGEAYTSDQLQTIGTVNPGEVVAVEGDSGTLVPVKKSKISEEDALLYAKLIAAFFRRSFKRGKGVTDRNLKFAEKDKKTVNYSALDILKSFVPFLENHSTPLSEMYFAEYAGKKFSRRVLNMNGIHIQVLDDKGKIIEGAIEQIADRLHKNNVYNVSNKIIQGEGKFYRISDVNPDTGEITYTVEDKEGYVKYLGEVSEGSPRLYTEVAINSQTTTQFTDPLTGSQVEITQNRTPWINMNIMYDYDNFNVEEQAEQPKKGRRRSYNRIAQKPQKPENHAEALHWFNEKFPQIPVHVIEGLIDGKSWGKVQSAALYLSTVAEEGTTYHEAWHIVTSVFLTEDERQSLYREWRNVTGKANLSDSDVEEALADEYMNHKLGVPSKLIKKGGKIEKFFEKISKFIRDFLNLSARDIQHIFERIEAGYYTKQPIRSISRKALRRPQSIENDYAFTQAGLKAMSVSFFDYFFGEDASEAAFNSLFNDADNSQYFEEAYDYIKETFEYESTADDTSAEIRTNYQRLLDNFDKLKELHKEELRRYNLEIIEDEEEESADQRDVSKNWGTNKLKFSVKSSASNRMRLILGTIAKVSFFNEYGFPEPEDFGKVFGLVVNRCAGSRNLNDLMNRLEELAINVPVIQKLIKRLQISKDSTGVVVLNSNASSQDATNLIDFINTFTQNFYNYMITTTGSNGKVKIIDVVTMGLRDKIRAEWGAKVSFLQNDKEYAPYYKVIKGILTYSENEFKKNKKVTDWHSAKEFLYKLGVTFKNEVKISSAERSIIIENAQYIENAIRNSNNLPMIFETNKESGVNGYLNKIIDIEQATRLDDFENSHFNIDSELVYNIGLNSYVTDVVNTINNAESLENLKNSLPWMKDAFVQSSVILKSVFKADKHTKIRFGILEGNREEHHSKSSSFHELSMTDKLATKINYILGGKFMMLRPGDNKQEKWFSIDKMFLTLLDVDQKQHYPILMDYLADELNRTKEILEKGSNIAFKEENAKDGIMISIINDFGNPALKEALTKLFQSEEISVTQFIDLYAPEIKSAFARYINGEIKQTKDLLVEYNVIDTATHINRGINSRFLKSKGFSDSELDYLLRGVIVNNMISSVEQMKLFYGDSISYKSILDQFKRHESFNSSKQHMATDSVINKFIDQNYVRTDEKTFENTNYNGEPVIVTAVLNDIVSQAASYEYLESILGKKAKAYKKQKEADAQGLISLDEYRELMIRSSLWTDDLNTLYQYELYGGERPQTKTKFVPLKIQYSGPLAEDGYNQAIYKLSVYPVVPSMARGRNLEALMNTMKENKIGIITFTSGVKLGYKVDENGKAQDPYTEEGNVNTTLTTQNTYYKHWGVQNNIAPKMKDRVPFGTQMMKQIFSGIFDKGYASPNVKALVQEYRDLNRQRIEIGVNQLVKKLGLKLEGDYYQINDIDGLVDTLQKEAKKRNLPDNIVEQIANIKADVGIDILVARERIEQYLMSIADKMTTSQKIFGNSAVQMSSAFFERNDIKRTKHEGVYESSNLKFYTLKEGGKQITRMQVLIPDYWRGKVKPGDDLLKVIGFRIPTQGMNSIEAIEIVGFLPNTCAEMVVLPSEIVAKSGGDFDIDKLTMYFPNYMVNQKTNRLEKIILKDDEAMRKDWESYTNQAETALLEAIFQTDLELGMSFEEYKKKALENRIYELQGELILRPENYENLMTPNTTDTLKSAAALVTWLREKRPNLGIQSVEEWYEKFIDNAKHHSITSLKFQLEIGERFQNGVMATGPTALASTFALACQEFNVHINSRIPFAHNTFVDALQNVAISLGGKLNSAGENISDLISQWINLSVDAAKEPHMSMMGVGTHNLPIILYLTLAGVDSKTIAVFINQPIIQRYYKTKLIDDSQIIEENLPYSQRSRETRYSRVIRAGGYKDIEAIEKEFTLEDLTAMVGLPSLTPTQQGYQVALLNSLKEFEEISESLSMAIRSTSFDTSAGGKNIVELLLRHMTVSQVLQDGVIQNYDKVVGVDENGNPDPTAESFLAPYYKAVHDLVSILRPFSKFLSKPELNLSFINYIYRQLKDHRGNTKTVLKNSTLFRQDFFTWLFMTQPVTINGQRVNIQDDIENLFYDPKENIATQLMKAKERLPENLLLQQLVAVFPHTKFIFGTQESHMEGHELIVTNNGVRMPYNIRFIGQKEDALDVNLLVGAWEDLMNDPFGIMLVKASLTQTGFQNSPMSFFSLLPLEVSNEIMNQLAAKIELIGDPQTTDNISLDSFLQQFDAQNTSTVPKSREADNPGLKRSTRFNRIDGADNKSERSMLPRLYDTVIEKEVNPDDIALTDYRGGHALKKYKTIASDLIIAPDPELNDSPNVIPDKPDKPDTPDTITKIVIDEVAGRKPAFEKDAASITFQEDSSTNYKNRTIKNASADTTIALAVDFNSAGEQLTARTVKEQGKTLIKIDANRLEVTPERVKHIVDILNSIPQTTLFSEISLNIAGNGIYTMKGKYTQAQVDEFTYQLLNAVTKSPDLKVEIGSIRTGGQTGFDEAGAKAGMRLGIPTTILAPKGWKFRDQSGTDISNEAAFKERFNLTPITTSTWSRYSNNGYEVSSKGDTRFSALYAKLKDGRTIEEAYQLDIKGYRKVSNNWTAGKGKPSLNSMSHEEQYQAYKQLWKQYLSENPELLEDLRVKSAGKVLTDRFASSDINQARALSDLLNETRDNNNEDNDENTSNVPFCLK